MPGGSFNGVEMLWVGVVVVGILVVLYARHRVSQDASTDETSSDPGHFSLDPDLDLAREVRKSYDNLTYRGRTTGMSEARREQ